MFFDKTPGTYCPSCCCDGFYRWIDYIWFGDDSELWLLACGLRIVRLFYFKSEEEYKMKKALSILLVAAFACGAALCGCSGKSDASNAEQTSSAGDKTDSGEKKEVTEPRDITANSVKHNFKVDGTDRYAYMFNKAIDFLEDDARAINVDIFSSEGEVKTLSSGYSATYGFTKEDQPFVGLDSFPSIVIDQSSEIKVGQRFGDVLAGGLRYYYKVDENETLEPGDSAHYDIIGKEYLTRVFVKNPEKEAKKPDDSRVWYIILDNEKHLARFDFGGFTRESSLDDLLKAFGTPLYIGVTAKNDDDSKPVTEIQVGYELKDESEKISIHFDYNDQTNETKFKWFRYDNLVY